MFRKIDAFWTFFFAESRVTFGQEMDYLNFALFWTRQRLLNPIVVRNSIIGLLNW